MSYDNIPLEMRTYRQWLVWRYEETEGKKPTKVPYSALTGRLASVTDPASWCSFDEARGVLTAHPTWYDGLGFTLTKVDPYSFIDLDKAVNEDGTPDNISLDRQMKIYNEFQSYAERSPSGEGLHIIVRGAVPSGRKRSKIEIYSDSRYMTMTGNVFRDAPITDNNEMLNALFQQMGEGKDAHRFYAGLEQAHTSDEEILRIANSAANAEKFYDLYTDGNWQKYYPSQSEADFALFDMIAFYSENGEQTKRIYLQSALAQRNKSREPRLISYMLNRCFDRMLPPIDIEHLRNAFEAAKAEKTKENSRSVAPPRIAGNAGIPETKPLDDVYSLPPGLVGEIAKFVYAQAPRQVPEIALTAALGLMAGIVGRAYNVSGTGLNQYFLLLAPTGSGKEAIAGGISTLMANVLRTVPGSTEFLGPGKINSPQALIKYLDKTSKSFTSVIGEFGFALREMANPNASPNSAMLLSILLDLYNKSGNNDVLRPSIYSDKDKNSGNIPAPAVSLIGETVPSTFYEMLHDGMIANGLLPRFTVIEYKGQRPPLNKSAKLALPSFDLIEKLATVCAHALQLNNQNKAINVLLDTSADEMFDKLNEYADLNINSSDNDTRKQLWNRAHLKALKLAALIAVGCNPYQPVVTVEIGTWAIKLVEADVRNMLARFDAGEIGLDNDETKQLAAIVTAVKYYLSAPCKDLVKYLQGEGGERLHGDRLISYTFLHRRLSQQAVFRKDRKGSTDALKRSLKTLVERGDLREVGRAELAKTYGTSALTYAVTNAKVFL